ncbi:MAG: hypothetical protein LRY27_01075 [Chitinophagales bacterium]|nr:hypothetical protein [Chitinophagales bacterium]
MLPTKVIVSNSENPFYNLAFEKWALNHLDTQTANYLFLYVNKPAVVVGRNQNIFEEVNIPYCIKNNIHICRRISGGGTVFHDEGNLNWCYITKHDLKKVNNYTWAVEAIFKLLKYYGFNPYLTERNAIEINALKVSGQAQFSSKVNLLSHGTLLVNSKLSALQKAIEPISLLYISSKASKSVRSQTVNISTLMGKELRCKQVIQDLLMANAFEVLNLHFNNEAIGKEMAILQTEKWVYERSPQFEVNDGKIILKVKEANIIEIVHSEDFVIEKYLDKPFKNYVLDRFNQD